MILVVFSHRFLKSPLHSSISDQIEASSGDRKTEEHQFFEKSCGRNFALVVEGRSVWVSREQLADLSEYFRAMFFGGFQESRSGANEVELPGKKADEVVELLRVIIPENYQFKPITRESLQNHFVCVWTNKFSISKMKRLCCISLSVPFRQ